MLTREHYTAPLSTPGAQQYLDWFIGHQPRVKSFTETAGAQMQWCKRGLWKSPFDLWTYQEIIAQVRPSRIVEFGTHRGGTALFLAHMLDVCQIDGRVLSVDVVDYQYKPEHPRLRYLVASSVSAQAEQLVRKFCCDQTVLIIEDSDHSYEHVHRELELYSSLVTPGSYFIVEDTYYRLAPDQWDQSPARACMEFVNAHEDQWEVDWAREQFGVSICHGGYLRRKAK
jgi:cephalosporin hydroxylase